MRILKNKTFKRVPEMEDLTHKSNELASRYWKLAASDRGRAYKEWLDCLKREK